jgi:hypothetical protein
MWNIPGDQAYGAMAQALQSLGYRFELDEFLPLTSGFPALPFAQHMTIGVGDEYTPVARFFASPRAVRSPAHVTYVVNPELDAPRADLRADHAYWVSGIRTRGPGLGFIDVRSEGIGGGEPVAGPLRRGQGVLAGGRLGPRPYAWTGIRWALGPRSRRRDRLLVVTRNVASLAIDARRAGLTCRAHVQLNSDGPVTVRFAGC